MMQRTRVTIITHSMVNMNSDKIFVITFLKIGVYLEIHFEYLKLNNFDSDIPSGHVSSYLCIQKTLQHNLLLYWSLHSLVVSSRTEVATHQFNSFEL